MKPFKRKIASALALFTLITTAQLASAFYDPSLGRWINRDPLIDRGFTTLHGRVSANRPTLVPAHTFALNNPMTYVDAFGLDLRYAGNCTQADKDKIEESLDQLCKKAKEKNCYCGLSQKGRNGMEQLCNRNGRETPTIYCDKGSTDYAPCGDPSRCGRTDMLGNIHICMNNIGKGEPPCDASCTLFHEGAHAVGGATHRGDGKANAYDIEACAGCPIPPNPYE